MTPVQEHHISTADLQFFSPIERIKEELRSRRQNRALRKKVMDFFGDLYPEFIDSQQPKAFLSRTIITPNMEMRFFLDMLGSFNLEPTFLEYPGKFVARNKEKYYLSKMRFFERTKKDRSKISVKNITDFNYWEGRPFADVTTRWGENIVDFHHRIFLEFFPQLNAHIHDITDWFNAVRDHYEHYYEGFYALAIYNGVIFENYLLDDKDEYNFFFTKALPSFKAIQQKFGVQPLIYPVVPSLAAGCQNWLYYPNSELTHLSHLAKLEVTKEGIIS